MKHTSVEHIIATLQSRGYRITTARRAIAEALKETPSPFTVQDIVARIHIADPVSVYRLFKTLQEERLLVSVPSTSDAKYELASEHHHHIICTSCGYTAHVPCEGQSIALSPQRPIKNFNAITGRDVTFYGTCTTCA